MAIIEHMRRAMGSLVDANNSKLLIEPERIALYLKTLSENFLNKHALAPTINLEFLIFGMTDADTPWAYKIKWDQARYCSCHEGDLTNVEIIGDLKTTSYLLSALIKTLNKIKKRVRKPYKKSDTDIIRRLGFRFYEKIVNYIKDSIDSNGAGSIGGYRQKMELKFNVNRCHAVYSIDINSGLYNSLPELNSAQTIFVGIVQEKM